MTETGYEKLRKAFPKFHEDCDPTHKEIQVIAGIDVKTISEIRTKVKGKNKSTLDKLFSAYNLDPDETTDYELKSKSTNSQKETSALAQVDNQNNNPADNQKNTQLSIQKFCCQEVVDKVEEIAQEHLQVFVGRETDLRRLDQFLVNHESGLMLVTAGAGFGKSALLANWRQKQLSKNYFVAYHCFNYRYETTRSLENAYRHLLAQLSNHYQLNLHSLPNNEIELRDRLYSSIKDIVANREHPCIFLIDSLDEADSPFERPFPPRLPEGVFVIASCRVDSDEVPSYLQTWKEVTKSTLILKRLNRSAIQEWLSHYRNEVLDRYFDDSNFVDKIYELTKGFPLYIRYLIEDLALASKNGEELEEVLEQTPKGFDQYVAKQINALDNLGLSELHRKFFALLTVAKGELSGIDIKGIAQIKDQDLRILQQTPKIVRWLKVSGQQFSFIHPLLAKTFAQNLGDEAEEILQKLLNYCSRWSEHFSSYALRLYAQHLLEMERFDDLQNLAKDSEYAIAQRKYLPNELDLNLKTVRISLKSAALRDDAVSMTECFFIYAQRQTEIIESPLQAFRVATLERALRAADLYEPQSQVIWYLLLAWESHKKGSRKEAQEILKQLKSKNLPCFSDYYREEDKQLIPENYIIIFLLKKIYHIDVEMFKDLYLRLLDDMSIARMCPLLIEEDISFCETAKKIASDIFAHNSRGYAFSEIGKTLARQGKIEKALEICDIISDRYSGNYHSCSSIFKEIAIYQSQHEDQEFEKAIESFARIEDSIHKYEAIQAMIPYLARAKKFNLISNTIKDIRYKPSILFVDEAKERYKYSAKQFSKAIQILDSALDLSKLEAEHDQPHIIQYIAEGFAFIGDENKALSVISKIDGKNPDYYQSIALAKVASVLAKKGNTDSASNLIALALKQAGSCEYQKVDAIDQIKSIQKQIESNFKNSSCNLKPISTLISNLNEDIISSQIVSLQTRISFIDPEEIKDIKQYLLVRYYVEKNNFIEAICQANIIKNNYRKLRTLIQVASAQYKNGQLIESLDIFENIFAISKNLDHHESEWFIDLIVVSLSDLGECSKALELIEKIELEWFRLCPLSTLGVSCAKNNKLEFVEKVLEYILFCVNNSFSSNLPELRSDESDKEYILSESGFYAVKTCLMAKNCQFEEALKISNGIRSCSINHSRKESKIFVIEELSRVDIDKALELLEGFLCKGWSNSDSNLWILSINSFAKIAQIQAKDGNLPLAKSIFKMALTKIDMIREEKYKSQALARVIFYQIKAGFFSWAIETTQMILDGRSEHLVEIAFKFADLQDKKNFKKILFMLPGNFHNSYSLCLSLIRLYPKQADALITVVP